MSKITVLEMNDIAKSAHAHNITEVLLDLGYEVNLIGFNADKIAEPMRSNKNCHMFHIVGKLSKNGIDELFKRAEKRRLIKDTFKSCMKDSVCVWVVSLAGFIPLKKEIIKYDNVVRVAELVDKLVGRDRLLGHSFIRRYHIEKQILKAQKIVVPEINRAYIQKVFWHLPELPTVLPNKPYKMETGVLPDNLLQAIEQLKREPKKIILYLGVVGPDRNIEDFAKAVSDSKEYAFYLAGNVLPYAKESLKRIEACGGKYLGIFSRPGHFELIKYAHIGALPYVPLIASGNSEINALYCAPNKIFEYAGMGVPMIGSDVFGLQIPFEKWRIGECCNNQPESILKAIKTVENNYEQMKVNCKAFYDSVDVKSIVQKTLSSIGIENGIKKIRIIMTVPDLLFAGIQSFAVKIVDNFDLSKYQIDFYVFQKFNEKTYEPYLEKLGCRVYYAQSNRTGLKGFLRTTKDFNKFLKSHHYDIAICHCCHSRGILKGVIGAKISRTPIVIAHAHGFDGMGNSFARKLKNLMYRIIIKMATDYRFACSQVVGKTKYGKSFTKSSKCMLLRNAVDLDVFKFSNQFRTKWRTIFGAQDGTLVVGNVARFATGKNHNRMLSIFADFNKKHPNSLMVFVGDGELMNSAKSKADKLGISDKVLFLGYCKNVNEIINAFDVFLFPSELEGLGFVLIESQVNGLPCVASEKVIPPEADIDIGLMTRVSLKATDQEWSDSCFDAATKDRKGPEECICAAKKAGYDIVEECEFLDGFFKKILHKE